jgi:hypothetical protein
MDISPLYTNIDQSILIETDNAEVYSSDIELVIDFMKLALVFNDQNEEVSFDNKVEIINLETKILQLMPVAQSNRMESTYKILKQILKKQSMVLESVHSKSDQLDQSRHEVYKKTDSVKLLDSREDRYILLFFDTNCSACKMIKPIWNEFKESVKDQIIYTVLEYDSIMENNPIFKKFNVEYLPSVIKLDLITSVKITMMKKQITLKSLSEFASFD